MCMHAMMVSKYMQLNGPNFSEKNATINFVIQNFKEQYGNEVPLAGQFNFSVTKMDESKKAQNMIKYNTTFNQLDIIDNYSIVHLISE